MVIKNEVSIEKYRNMQSAHYFLVISFCMINFDPDLPQALC